MRILFGPQHDGLHVDPAAPGAYEWWYFDALSDDGRYALVVIFFLGSPMSPYYKAVVDGKNPDPRDWCGVFVTLHERVKGRWKERSYAYNLYGGGEFAPDGGVVTIGGSILRRTPAPPAWDLTLREPGLWFGSVAADLTFSTVGAPLDHAPMGEDDGHTWACVAPLCRVEGTVGGIAFAGSGYHDHNFGQLPWGNVDVWYWVRAHLDERPPAHTALLYEVHAPGGESQRFLGVFDTKGCMVVADTRQIEPRGTESMLRRGAYGLLHRTEFYVGAPLRLAEDERNLAPIVRAGYDVRAALSSGPFYLRTLMNVALWVEGAEFWGKSGEGIGEVFRPARLCGPIASRAMWTRIRRRKSPPM